MKISFSILCFLCLLCGCRSIPKTTVQSPAPIFYPAAPDEPRLQFLASFSSSEDLEPAPSRFRKFIADEENTSRPIVKPYGIAVYGDKIYLCDTVHNGIDILDLKKRKFSYFRPKQEAQLIDPINICFDNEENMYVADSRRGQIVIFSSTLDYRGAIGKKSEFKPTGVAVKDDKIYMCDLKSRSVLVFGLKDKHHLFSIPRQNAAQDALLFSPTNIAIDEAGNLYVSDLGAFRVQKYSPSGEFLMSFGSHGDSLGQFARPKGVAVDREGRVYVVDAAFENIQIFDKEGKLLLFFAEPGGSPVSMVLPAGITIDYSLKDYFSPLIDPSFEVEYLILATSQYGDRKLSIFGFGHKK